MKTIFDLNREIREEVKDVIDIEHPGMSDLFLGSEDMPSTCNIYDADYKEDGKNTLSMSAEKIEIAKKSTEGFFEQSTNNKIKLTEKGKEYLDSVLLECSKVVYKENPEIKIKCENIRSSVDYSNDDDFFDKVMENKASPIPKPIRKKENSNTYKPK